MAFPVDEEKEKEKVQEQRLRDIMEAGSSLLNPPSSTEELLKLLDKSNNMMIYMEQSNSEPTKRALLPLRNALKSQELFGTLDVDVKLSVISCISEMMRITAPEPPYDDDVLNEFFHLFVPVLAYLSQSPTSSIYRKAALILEVAAEVRFCVIMVELKLEKLIIEMFQLFMKTIRSDHPDTVFKHMETIMTLVIEESEDDISLELLTSLLDSVRKDNLKFSPASWKLGDRVLKSVAAILKPCIQKAVHSSVISLGDYSEIVTSICDNGSTNKEDLICGYGEHVETRADEKNTGHKTDEQSLVAKTSAPNGETVLIEKSAKPLRPGQLSEIIKSVQVHDNGETDELEPMKAFKQESNAKIVPKIGNGKPKSRILLDKGYNLCLDSTCKKSPNRSPNEEGIDCSHSSEKAAFLSTKDQVAEPPTSSPKVNEIGGSFIAKNSSLPDGSHRKRGRPKKNKIVLNEDGNIDSSSVANVDLVEARVKEKTRESIDVPHKEGINCSHFSRKTSLLSTKDQVAEPPTSSSKVSEVGGSFIAKSSSLPDGSPRRRGRPKKNKIALNEDGNINSSSVSNVDLLEARVNEKTLESVDVSVKKDLDDASHLEGKQDSEICHKSRNRNLNEEGIDCSHSSQKTDFPSKKDQVAEPSTSLSKVSEVGGSFIGKNSSVPDGSRRKRGRPKKNKIVLSEDVNIGSSSVSDVDLLEARVNEKTWQSEAKQGSEACNESRKRNPYEEEIDCSHSSKKTNFPSTKDQVAERPTSSPNVSEIGGSFIAKNSSVPDGSRRKRGRPKKNKIVLNEDGNIGSSSVYDVDLLEARVNERTCESVNVSVKKDLDDTSHLESKQDSPFRDDFLVKDILKGKQKRDFAAGKEKASVMTELDERLIGKQIKVWWPLDKRFYVGAVHSFDHQEMKHKVLYTDGEEELLNLNEEHWKLFGDDVSPDGEQEDDLPNPGDSSCEPLKRRRSRKSESDGQAKKGSSSKRGRPPKKPKVEVDSEADDPAIGGTGNIEKSTGTGSKSTTQETIVVSTRVDDSQTCNVTGSEPTTSAVTEYKTEDPQKSASTSSKLTTPDTVTVPKERGADLPLPSASSHTPQEQKRDRKSGSVGKEKSGSFSKRGRPPKTPKVEVDSELDNPVVDRKGNIEKSTDTSFKAAAPETMTFTGTGSKPTTPDTVIASKAEDSRKSSSTSSKLATPDSITLHKEREADLAVPNTSSHISQKQKRNRKLSVGQEKSGSISKRGRPPKKPRVEVDRELDIPVINGKGNAEKSADTSSKSATPETLVVSSMAEDPQKSIGTGSKAATPETVIASKAEDPTKSAGARPKPTTPDTVIVPKEEQDADLPVPNASSHTPEKRKRNRKSESVGQGSTSKRGRPPKNPKDGQAKVGSSAKRGRPPKKPMVEVDIKPEQTSSAQD